MTAVPAPEALGQRAARGMLWLMAQSMVARLSSFASQIVLAWLLVPADFGKVGLALTISNIAATLVSFGVDDVLLQRQRRMALWARTAFWISVALGVAGAALVAAAAPFAAAAYGSPEVAGLVVVLAAAIAIGSLATVPTAAIRGALDFRFLALFNAWEVLTIQGGTVLLAWLGAGAYSFVVPIPVVAAAKVAAFWWRARPALGGRIRPRLVRAFAGRGLMVAGNRLLTELVQHGDYIVLGLISTPAVVGLYFFAFRLAAMPVRMLAGNFQNVMFPTLARLVDEPARQRRTAFEAARLLAFVVMPLCMLQAALAEPVLRLLFGAKWEGAIPLAQILSLGLPFDAVAWVAGSLLSARGEFRRLLIFAAALAPAFLVMVSAGGLLGGAVGTAAAVSLYFALGPALMVMAVFRPEQSRAATVVGLYLVPGAVGAAAVAAGLGVAKLLLPAEAHLARCVVIAAVAAAVGVPLTWAAAPDVMTRLAERFLPIARGHRLGRLGPAKV